MANGNKKNSNKKKKEKQLRESGLKKESFNVKEVSEAKTKVKKIDEVILMGPSSDEEKEKKVKPKVSKKDERRKEEKTIKSATIDGNTFLEDTKKVNLGKMFAGIVIVFFGLVFLGQSVGWFGSLDVHFLKLWPLLVIIIGLSFFKIDKFWNKVVGISAIIVVFIMALVWLLSNGNITTIILSGNIVQENRELPDFSRISFEGVGDVSIKQGEETLFVIEADENIVAEVVTEVVDDTLIVKYRNPLWNLALFDEANVDIKITTLALESIKMSGSGSVNGADIVSDELEISLVGDGSVYMDVYVQKLISRIVGSGEFNLSGKSDRQLVYITGSGKYDSRDLVSNETGVRIAGSGEVIVNTENELDASISGSGTVRYIGSPEISNSDISGSGSIEVFDPLSELNEEVDVEEIDLFEDIEINF